MINIFSKSIYIVFKIYILFIMTWYMPFSYIVQSSNISLSLDLFFLYLIIQSILLSRVKLIFIGFLIGFFMDIDGEGSFIGINSFLIPAMCYFLGFLKLNSNNWDLYTKIVYLVVVCVLSYTAKVLFYQWDLLANIIPIVINSIIIIMAFLSINVFYYKRQLIK